MEKGSERLVDPRNATRRYIGGPGASTVVLLHGLTATPNQFEALAPLLVARGRNVLIPRLPHHGYADRMTEALARLEVAELIATVKYSLREAAEMGGPVTVAGFSLGGALAAYAAQRETVERAVCIAPFFGVRWLPRMVNRSAPWILGVVPTFFVWWDPIKRRGHGAGDGYPRYPTSALREAYVLADALFDDAAENSPLTKAIAVVTNPAEFTCDNSLTQEMVGLWRAKGAAIETVELEGLGPSHDFMTPRSGNEKLRALAYPAIVDAIIGR